MIAGGAFFFIVALGLASEPAHAEPKKPAIKRLEQSAKDAQGGQANPDKESAAGQTGEAFGGAWREKKLGEAPIKSGGAKGGKIVKPLVEDGIRVKSKAPDQSIQSTPENRYDPDTDTRVPLPGQKDPCRRPPPAPPRDEKNCTLTAGFSDATIAKNLVYNDNMLNGCRQYLAMDNKGCIGLKGDKLDRCQKYKKFGWDKCLPEQVDRYQYASDCLKWAKRLKAHNKEMQANDCQDEE